MMLKKIVQTFTEQRQLLKNLSYLSVFELINTAFPIVITPLIITRVGLDNFGIICFLQAIILTLGVVTNWGFSISAIRDISQIKEDNKHLSQLVSEIFFSILFITISLGVLYYLCLLLLANYYMYALAFFLLIGNTFYPSWLIMGLEENQYLIVGALIRNIIYGTLVYFFIKQNNDFIYVLFYQGIAYSGASFCLLAAILKIKKINLKTPSFSNILSRIVKNTHIFVSTLSLTTSIHASTIILKFFVSDFLLGIYGLAKKLESVSKLGLTVFSSSIYPRVCVAVLDSTKNKLRTLIKSIYFPFIGIYILFIFFVLFFIKPILLYLDDTVQFSDILIVSTLFIVPLITLLNIMPALTLLANKKDNIYSKVTIQSAVLSIVLLLILVPAFNIYGAIITAFMTEIFLVCKLYREANPYLPKVFK